MNIKKILQSLLPGIFLLGFNIGTGSVTAMAKAGATYGMSLLWALCLSCIITYCMIIFYSRYTLITGETVLYAFKKHIHPAVGIFFIVGLTVAVCGSVIGVMGIISDICSEWSKYYVPGGIHAFYFAFFFVGIVYLLFLNGKTRFFEKSLAVIVAIMAVSFIINFFLLMPDPIDVIRGLIPNLPKMPVDQEKGPFLVIASIVGTTVASCIFIVRSTLVKEAGWTLKDEGIQKRDAMFSAFMMFIISMTIMAAAAGTLFVNDLGLTNSSQMLILLEPLAGRLAVSIFVSGIVAAGLSSQFPNVILLPWMICDYTNTERDMTKPLYRIIVLIISVLGLMVPIYDAPPVFVMIASQAFGALLLPGTVFFIFILMNRRAIVGEHINHRKENLILGLIFIFSLAMSGSSIRGLISIWR